MPITELQRERRRNHIGSSDVAAIFNMDPFRSAADVWASKKFDLEDQEPTEAMDIGNHLERGLLELAAKKHNLKIKIGGPTRVSKVDPLFAANPDALDQGQPQGMEAKVVGRHNYEMLSQYGEEGTNEIPDSVQLQVQQQMFVVDLQAVIVVAYLAGDFRTYTIDRDDELIDAMTQRCRGWWDQHVIGGEMPSDEKPDLQILKRVRRVPKSIQDVESFLAEQFERSQYSYTASERYRDQCKAALISAMHDKEAADWGDPKSVYTYLEQTRPSLDADALKAAHPDIAAKFTKTTKYRVLRKTKRSIFDEYCSG